MDATKMRFPNNYFSSIVSIENIEHVEDYIRYIKEIYRVLKPNGRLFITTPRVNRMENLILKLKGCKIPQNPYHKHEFKVKELKNLLEKYGFRILEIKGLYLHIFPTRFNFTKRLINIERLYKILVNFSFIPLNDYFYIVAEKK